MARHRLLLIEDNPDDVELMRHASQASGVDSDIMAISDGRDALDYLFTERSAPPAMVILDLSLPGISGFDVLRAIRGNPATRRMPVVIFSASDNPEDIVRGYDAGANSFIRKPEGFAAFTGIFGQLQRYWLGFNIMPPPV